MFQHHFCGHNFALFYLERVPGCQEAILIGNNWKKLSEKHYFSSFWPFFVTKSVKFGRTEVSIPPIDAKFQDLSIQRVVKGWFLKFGGEKSIFHSVFGWFFKEKKHVFVTKSVGKRFHELSLGRNDRLGLGTSKIEVLAKIPRKNRENQWFSSVFPACGVGFLTSSRRQKEAVIRGKT